MKRILGPAVVILALVLVQEAHATSAQEMLSDCRSLAKAPVSDGKVQFAPTFATGRCWGSFLSIQRFTGLRDTNGKLILPAICVPPEIMLTQLVSVFVVYAEKNPQLLHQDYFVVAMNSLRQAFPCPAIAK